jgi:desulfoferrodoxin (superoxide reductase-like protein)
VLRLSGSTSELPSCQEPYGYATERVEYARREDCVAIVADAYRRQLLLNLRLPDVFTVPYVLGSTNEKHNPYVVLDALGEKVVVGKSTATGAELDPIHPMVDDTSSNGANLHFIDTIWVEDQDGAILILRILNSSEPKPATLYFDIPPGTVSVRAYEFCNIHGLLQGDEVAVTTSNICPSARSGCSMQQCIDGTSVSTCQVFSAEFERRQGAPAKDDHTESISHSFCSIVREPQLSSESAQPRAMRGS